MRITKVLAAGAIAAIVLSGVTALHPESHAAKRRKIVQPKPDVQNESYGPHTRNVFDLWKAKSDKPAPLLVYFHGGGFYGGDKNRMGQGGLIDAAELTATGIAVAAVNYRLTDSAPYPAQMHDAARAIQHLRHHAKKWNIDPKRVTATGGSAGGGISLWLAFHDDLADPKAEDPVLRESTRLTCAVGLRVQCTYDPREIAGIVPGNAADEEPRALRQLFGLPKETKWETLEVDEKLDKLMKDASPITHLTRDDPPVFLYHQARQGKTGSIHHPNFGRHLEKAMKELGVECVRRLDTDYDKLDTTFEKERMAFLKKHFGMEGSE